MKLRRRLAVSVLAVGAPLLAGCGANFNAATNEPYNPAVGTNNQRGSVDVLNALVVSAKNGSGTVIASLVNKDVRQPDTLVGLRATGLQVQGSKQVSLPAQTLVDLAPTGSFGVTGQAVKAGYFVKITFDFGTASPATLEVPVVRADNPAYSSVKAYAAAPSPSPSPSGSAPGSPSSSPSAKPSAKPSSKPSAKPSSKPSAKKSAAKKSSGKKSAAKKSSGGGN